MSQPIDTAFVEVRPDLDRFAAELKQRLDVALKQVQTAVDRSMRQTGDRVAAAGKRAGQQFGDALSQGFDRTSQAASTAFRDIDRDASNVRAFEVLSAAAARTRASFEQAGQQAGRGFGVGFIREAGDRIRDARSRIADAVGDDDSGIRAGRRIGARVAEGITNALAKAGGPIADAVGGAFTALPPQAQVAIGAGVVTAVAAVAPAIGATVAGAVVAGVGTGAVAAGVAAAFQDPRVKTAAQQLGDEVKAIFRGVGQDFAGDTVASLRAVRSAVRTLGLREVFAPAASYLRPLTDGLIGLVRNVLPGLRSAIAAADKPIRAIAAGLPQLGSAVGSLLQTFARHADAGAKALTLLFDVISVGVKLVEVQISALAAAFDFFDRLPAAVTGLAGVWVDSAEQSDAATSEWDTSLEGLQAALSGVGDATVTTTQAVKNFHAAMLEATNVDLSARAAKRDLEAAIDDATAAIDENGRTLDIGTEKGRANQAAIDAIRGSAFAAAAAIREQGGSQAEANAVVERARKAFVDASVAAGQNRKEVENLSRQLFALPDDTTVNVKANTKGASSAVDSLRKQIRLLDGSTITVRARITSSGNIYIPGQGTQIAGAAHGGLIRGPGSGTSDSILRRVSDYEFVVQSEAVKRPGMLRLLEQINAGRVETRAASARLAALTTPPPAAATSSASMAGPASPTAVPPPTVAAPTVQVFIDGQELRGITTRVVDERIARNNTAQARALTYRPRTV